MLHPLFRHPVTSASAVHSLMAEVARTGLGDFVIHYQLTGDIEAIKLPPPVRYGSRADSLWQTTCFEAFVRPIEGVAYLEFNFAPSTAWAAYRLENYRSSLTPLEIPLCQIDVEHGASQLDMFITLDASDCEQLPPDSHWFLNLTAVIEEREGTKSYWALNHPPEGPPDFHHPACFTLELPPAPAP